MLSMWASNPLCLAVGQRGARPLRRHVFWLTSIGHRRTPNFESVSPLVVEISGLLILNGPATWRPVCATCASGECTVGTNDVPYTLQSRVILIRARPKLGPRARGEGGEVLLDPLCLRISARIATDRLCSGPHRARCEVLGCLAYSECPRVRD